MNNELNAMEMAKKRDRKIAITDEAISKVPVIEYKSIPSSQYRIINELAKEALIICHNISYVVSFGNERR